MQSIGPQTKSLCFQVIVKYLTKSKQIFNLIKDYWNTLDNARFSHVPFFSPSWVHEPTFKPSLPHLPQKLTVLVHSSNEWRSILRSITANITPLHKEFQGVLVNPPPVVAVAAPTISFPSDNERQLLMNQEILRNPHLNFRPASSIPRNASTLHVAQPQTTTHLMPAHEDHTSLSSQQEETTHADHTSLPAEQEAMTSTDHTSPLLPPVSKHLSMAEN